MGKNVLVLVIILYYLLTSGVTIRIQTTIQAHVAMSRLAIIIGIIATLLPLAWQLLHLGYLPSLANITWLQNSRAYGVSQFVETRSS